MESGPGSNIPGPVSHTVDYIEDENGCWVWQRSRLKTGYGVAWVGSRPDRRKTTAHRIYYERHVGPIPDGMHLDHLCRNRSCVNPAHLEPVTPAENQRRGSNTNLTAEIAQKIRESVESRAALAERYGIAVSTVSGIRAGQRWREDT